MEREDTEPEWSEMCRIIRRKDDEVERREVVTSKLEKAKSGVNDEGKGYDNLIRPLRDSLVLFREQTIYQKAIFICNYLSLGIGIEFNEKINKSYGKGEIEETDIDEWFSVLERIVESFKKKAEFIRKRAPKQFKSSQSESATETKEFKKSERHKCFNCQEEGHRSAQCPKGKGGKPQ
ncbi:hypothetical protein DICPUDRAFT_146637 [Dictyostelium purpureum]|uniref:CCHC-type domain-containing protein n=1 Tax=Dictyostelium purpureum TaxID=5786 RepID=F0Z6H4_DICPU|nr:uncharacterized protein DICPUDRAFT_146637 [Dictyostelium purpureum]EGC40492.1 hypothetical protein DICPUDRAFT_146637 [Dictyostelium purpureum]|eukprot:XP_003283039.1 hypothetical protein DICPUDRAFT_146637 [Dictyostelium purpureum]